MNFVGRPRKEIDFKLVENMCQIQCTKSEIASVLQVSEDTIEKRIAEQYNCNFTEYYKRHSEGGKASLRRSMFKSAHKGNVTAQIWLSKQHLGMRDPKQLSELTIKDDESVAKDLAMQLNQIAKDKK